MSSYVDPVTGYNPVTDFDPQKDNYCPGSTLYGWHPKNWIDKTDFEHPAGWAAVTAILNASPGAFAILESELSSTALIAETTANGLTDAQEAPDWRGPASDAYRQSVGDMPITLLNAHEAYLGALRALTTFAEATYEHAAKLRQVLAQTDADAAAFSKLITYSYPKPDVAGRIIGPVQTSWTAGWTTVHQILAANAEDRRTFANALTVPTKLAPEAPPQKPTNKTFWGGFVHLLLSPVEDIYDTVAGTGKRFSEFLEHPSWATFGELTESLSLDAGLIALAASGAGAAADLTLGDGATTATADLIADLTGGASVGLYGDNIIADGAQGRYGSVALKSLLILAPDAGDLAATTELDRASNNAALLDRYRTALDQTGSEAAAMKQLGLNSHDAAELKELVKQPGDATSVAQAQKDADEDLKAARVNAAKDALKDNTTEHIGKDPVVKVGGNTIDGRPADGPDEGGVPNPPTSNDTVAPGTKDTPGCIRNGMGLPAGIEPGPGGISS